ncbi:uncharacterized protein [Vicugna pacos]|uniref:Uncharacterized protein n=1 Tax=Vicugna pacos TaxID=30538 RepID=A0ABM5BWG1_VICPA
MVFQDISLPSRSTETCYSMPQHLVSQLTGLSCTEENEFGLNNTSTYLASWTLGLRAALPHTGAYDNCLPSAPPVHVSPSTFPRLPSSSPILPPSVPLLSQDPERIAGPPAHAQLLPAGPRVGSSSSEPGIGPNGFSALSPCRPLATAWGRGLWLWKCKVRGYRERGEAAAGGRSACHSPPGRQSACVQLDCSGQTPLPAPPAPAHRPQLPRARSRLAAWALLPRLRARGCNSQLLLVESGKGSGSAEGASVSLIRISAPGTAQPEALETQGHCTPKELLAKSAVQEFLIDPVLRNSFRVGKTSASQNPQFQM